MRLVSRVAPRTLGYRDPKWMAGGGSGTQVPAPQPHAMGGLGIFPQLGLSLVTHGQNSTLFMLPAPPGRHEGKTQAKLPPGEVGGSLHRVGRAGLWSRLCH